MLLKTHSFEFGDFCLEGNEKILLRQGKPVSLTPKALQLLSVLVENHGKIVEKEDLMRTVWADSFVEESNLTFTISILRKTLNDGKTNRFIETIPKRGYRFVAEVRKINQTGDFDGNSFISRPPRKYWIPAALCLLLSTMIAVGWYARSKTSAANFSVLTNSFASEKLSTNGKVFHAVVSPNGKEVVYTNINGGKQSIWMRQLESASAVEIIAPSNDTYGGLALSPDGTFIYFSRQSNIAGEKLHIYRISIFGGVPARIADDTQGFMSISPDGKQISFVRCPYRAEEYCSLYVADAADGKNERKLVSRPKPFRIADNKFSPDGKTIAFAAGQSHNAANEFGLFEVEVENGAERELTTNKFFNIRHLAWLPDQSGLLITAARIPNKNFLIWQISPSSDEAVPLTKDSDSYSRISLDKAGNIAVATQVQDDFHLSIYQMDNPANKQKITAASSAVFAPNEKIVFSSQMFGNDEIWSMNADGSNQRQLTDNPADDTAPIVSPDGKFIFFASNRTGVAHLWRMNADGSNPLQITQLEGGFPLRISPDGRWVYYRSGVRQNLWKASTNGDSEQLLADKRSFTPAFSPDDSQVAYLVKRDGKGFIDIYSLDNWQTIKTFPLAEGKTGAMRLVWSDDGKNLYYLVADNEHKNNALWRQPLDTAAPPQKVADLGDEIIQSFALDAEGKSFAVVQGNWRHDAVLLKGLR